MPVSWMIAPYKRRAGAPEGPTRYCLVNDFTAAIEAEGGRWAEAECLGDHAIVKISASIATLDTIAGTPGVIEVPRRWARLLDSFGDMTAGERNQIQNKLLGLGFTQTEIDAALGSNLIAWRTHTLADLLRLLTSRRLQPRYDSGTDAIILDGPVQPCESPDRVDAAVSG